MPSPTDYDVVNKKFSSSSSGKDVKDTNILKGEAHNSLTGSNVTEQDVRTAPSPGRTGGISAPKG